MNKDKNKGANTLPARVQFAVLKTLNENGGEMRPSVLERTIAENEKFSEYENELNKYGVRRWQTALRFFAIDLTKAGYIVKNGGVWYITDAGREAMALGPEEVRRLSKEAYRRWRRERGDTPEPNDPAEAQDDARLSLEEVRTRAADDITDYIAARDPYEFQTMVAALFRAMGYYTPFIAPRGRDGGIDIVAYSDPLGATQPRLKVQVKHYNPDNAVPVEVIRGLHAVAGGDSAIAVTSGRFTESARTEARQYNIRLIDGSEFMELWIRYYERMPEDDRRLMPIEPVYFIKRED